MKKNKLGFTLVEILIVMAIVVALAVAMTGAFNPRLIIDKAGDARRKKDLNRIKTALEEYYNDNGNFPDNNLAAQLNLINNCGSVTIFKPWLALWPCDPSNNPYHVVTGNNWFEVYADLKNKKDTDILGNWYAQGTFFIGGGDITNEQYNYCVSSTNIDCTRKIAPPSSECFVFEGATCKPPTGYRCRDEGDGNCFIVNYCNINNDAGRVSCCGDWCY